MISPCRIRWSGWGSTRTLKWRIVRHFLIINSVNRRIYYRLIKKFQMRKFWFSSELFFLNVYLGSAMLLQLWSWRFLLKIAECTWKEIIVGYIYKMHASKPTLDGAWKWAAGSLFSRETIKERSLHLVPISSARTCTQCLLQWSKKANAQAAAWQLIFSLPGPRASCAKLCINKKPDGQ